MEEQPFGGDLDEEKLLQPPPKKLIRTQTGTPLGFRSKTMGARLDRQKTVFQWTPDGKLREIKVIDDTPPTETAPSDKTPSKFGRLQTGPKSVNSGFSGATTVVAFSEQDYPVAKGQDEGPKFGKVRGKPGLQKRNLVVIPFLLFVVMLTGGDEIQSAVQILTNKDFYDLSPTKSTGVNSLASSIALLVAIPVIIVGGIFYDIMGRMKTIALCFFFGAVSTIMVPLCSPSVALWTASRIIFQCQINPILMNPFVNDYATAQTRGAAMGMQQLGVVIGNLSSTLGLFTLTNLLTNKYVAFGLMAGLQILWVFILYFGKMVHEPSVMNSKEEKKMKKKSVSGLIYSNLKQVWKACKQDPYLANTMLAAFVGRNGQILQQFLYFNWLTLAMGVDVNSPTYEDDLAAATKLWQIQTIIGNVCSMFFITLCARLCDRFPGKIMIPGTLIFQCLMFGMAYFIWDPSNWYGYLCCVPQAGSTMMVAVALQSDIAKRTPKMVRGTLMAVLGAIYSLGSCVYTFTAGYAMAAISANMCFLTLIGFNILTLIFIFIQIKRRKFGRKPKFNDGKSDDGSDKTISDKRGADEGKGGYDDIPQIYDEQILEADDDMESTLKGSIIESKRDLLQSNKQLEIPGSHKDSFAVSAQKDEGDLIQMSMKNSLLEEYNNQQKPQRITKDRSASLNRDSLLNINTSTNLHDSYDRSNAMEVGKRKSKRKNKIADAIVETEEIDSEEEERRDRAMHRQWRNRCNTINHNQFLFSYYFLDNTTCAEIVNVVTQLIKFCKSQIQCSIDCYSQVI